ncbi:Serine/threonine-protein kinase DCLK [Pyrenophora tritici-repentis]|uniref:Serine/threonine-protein kinase DCLK n=1 Tax=Pyrenophora tritici-repentis TaxID=45151 RepID=A0A5M9KR23_9PLEO|nr:Serine/threonine-protein kinase DCLK [Pyrenophora tritici-repentis]KAI0581943.1 Serine/threonine-protein kinase DCLK [Pyrenophora tritici-repentis]KAI1509327.1 Serine/threonine-protein kinase DCLK [Pyrenophora tritici-repentis]KAI1574552.1 Serine threonine-protein kinase DCLK [Pyrenophora tritici-repentis]KAI1603892.1 hypothetical protein PtrCC142_003909 [Pyrenophora tritici-repentis]
MSSLARLAPGQTLAGARWDYRIVNAIKGDNSHQSTVYKAEVHPRTDVSDSPNGPTVIKTASSKNESAMSALGRKCATYRLPGVSSAPCFRKLYDEIDDCTLACEWLETTLGDLRYRPEMRIYAIIKACLNAALASCVVLDDQGYVNTDFKPVNILLSGNETIRITAEVGDLGLVYPSDSVIEVQPYAMRAPEVFLGHSCNGPGPVWAVAATLLCWINPRVWGIWDCPHPVLNEAWCMAKIKRLFPDWELPAPGGRWRTSPSSSEVCQVYESRGGTHVSDLVCRGRDAKSGGAAAAGGPP